MKWYIVVVILTVSYSPVVQAQKRGVGQAHRLGPTLPVIPPEFKGTTLKDRVAEAIGALKRNDASFLLYLVESHKGNSDELLTLLSAYLDDPDGRVKSGLVDAAASAHSIKAFKLLTDLVDDHIAGHDAAQALYLQYTRLELLDWGGRQLKGALFRGVLKDREATYGNILLSLYKGDTANIAFLQRRRRSFILHRETSSSTPATAGSQKPIDDVARRSTTECILTIDLALAELGEAYGLDRVMQVFSQRNVEDLLTLTHYLKFEENKAVLLHTAELINDKRGMTKSLLAGPPGSVPHEVRICDEALKGLKERFGLGQDTDAAKHYSDQELAQAYKRIRSIIDAR